MKKIKIFSLLVLFIFILVGCQDEDEKATPTVLGRTVFMYLVADNSISSDIYSNIASVEQGLAAVTYSGKFVIYWDGGSHYSHEFPNPTLFEYEVDGKGGVSERRIVRTYNNQNSVAEDVMLAVFKDMQRLCPAESYGLIMGSHATGWLPVNYSKNRSFGDDGGSRMNIPELAAVLKRSSIHFDYILFDACLMSQVEVAYQLRNVADYLILSPAEVMDVGFPYYKITKDLMATNDLEQNVVDIAKGYMDYYKNEASSNRRWGTIAVVKMAEMQALATITHSIMNQYYANLSAFTSSKLSDFQSRYGYGRSPLNYSSYDFKAFIRELVDGNLPVDFIKQLDRTIIYKDYTDQVPLVNIDERIYSGIGCYIPYVGYANWNHYFKNLQWYSAAGWAEAGW